MENGVYSQRLRAGRRRTYFFDVRTTKSDDYYITITESKKRFDGDGYDRHKLFLYKEDFNKFISALENTVNHVKQDLMPDYDFSEFDRAPEEYTQGQQADYSFPDNPENEDSETKSSTNYEDEFSTQQEIENFIDDDLTF